MKIIGSLIVSVLLCFGAYSYYVSQPLFDTRLEAQPLFKIAGRSQALTFARSNEALILVLKHHGDRVSGINLTQLYGSDKTANLIDLYHSVGYQALSEIEGPLSPAPLSSLIQPYHYTGPHLAAGTNYSEHAEEVHLDDPPFIFPKLAQTTAWNADVTFTQRLDYEAELCMVPLHDIYNVNKAREFGLILCNDFSDRYTLLKQLKLSEPMGTTGFADAKGKSSFFPTGYLFVIPKEADFYLDIALKLHVNNRTRQDFSSATMILKVDDIVNQAFSLKETPFYTNESSVSLLPHGKVTQGSIILTGTSAGVIFKPINIWNQGFYLSLGDEVITSADFLGHLNNRIVSE